VVEYDQRKCPSGVVVLGAVTVEFVKIRCKSGVAEAEVDEVGAGLLFFYYRKINKTICPTVRLHCRQCTNSANSFKF
jgi:hypothetical protein